MRILFLLLAMAGLILFLQWQFPYAVTDNGQWLRILYMLMWLVLIGGGWRLRRLNLSKSLEYAVIWLAVIVLLVTAYSFHGGVAYNRFVAELLPDRVQVGAGGTLSVRASQDGHFHIEADVNGVPVGFMVDTGASDIVLSPRDAQRAGFPVETLNYSRTYRTANGMVSGAPVMIDTLAVGPVTLRHVPASVNGAAMDESLLGMSFLNRLKGYSVDGDTLTLVP